MGYAMIKILTEKNHEEIESFIKRDSSRNYFIRLTLEKGLAGFYQIFGQYDGHVLMAIIFKRFSGNLQIYATDGFDANELSEKLKGLQFDKLISAASFCDKLDPLLFENIVEGAYLVELKNQRLLEKIYDRLDNQTVSLDLLAIADLEEITDIYKKVFTSYSSIPVMEKKLLSGRGRGYVLRKTGRIVAVAQSEFEEEKSALIVAVATEPDDQKKGYGSLLMGKLCHVLLGEGKRVFLQFDNPEAGKMYASMGFERFDQIKHYSKRQ